MKAILKKVKSLGKMSITTSINGVKIEQANGWLDGYKGLIMRYEYLDVTWIGMLLLGFISKFLKKV